MDAVLGSTVEIRFLIEAGAAADFLAYVNAYRSATGAAGVSGGVTTGPSSLGVSPGPEPASDGPTDGQIDTFWSGLREMGPNHGIVRIVCWWLDEPGHHNRDQTAIALDLFPAQVSNWMRTLRIYLQRAGLPVELYRHRDGMGFDEPYASALRRGRPADLAGGQ